MHTGVAELDKTLEQVLSAARDRFGAGAVARIAASKLTVFEGGRGDGERQRPTWVDTPGLASRPFWAPEQCGRLRAMISAMEEAQPAILKEIGALNPSRTGVPYDHLTVAPEAIRGWKNLFFFRDYKGDEALLDKVPSLRAVTARFGQEQLDRFELFLSVLEPGTHIPPHYGGANVKLTLHLPLWIPEGDAALRVDDQTHGWTGGKMMIFDDTFEHEAWNRTGELRAVLLLKAYHPDLTPEEIGVLEMFGPLNVRIYRELLKQRPGLKVEM